MGKTAFVTVGSTGFDDLVASVCSLPVLNALTSLGFERVIVQYGSSKIAFREVHHSSIKLEGFDYKPSVREEMGSADLVISHAGSGSILEALRLSKPLIVVINSRLMDNHQAELAHEMERAGYLVATECGTLAETILSHRHTSLTPFPPPEPSRFATLLDQVMDA
ncbi:uncharacterized protein VTP21DRAFT_3279 [Calcarisporiella thermophila]|uniref:uncharacterized protein n=1 Tax=Calcarisporiella thermophila TaxID=911321 RepID=UPI003743EAF4